MFADDGELCILICFFSLQSVYVIALKRAQELVDKIFVRYAMHGRCMYWHRLAGTCCTMQVCEQELQGEFTYTWLSSMSLGSQLPPRCLIRQSKVFTVEMLACRIGHLSSATL